MSRPLRIEFPGALYHVTARGNARQDIFLDSEDARRFLRLLAETCGRHDWRVYSYCLMTNHYHLVVETREANLSRGMRRLNGVYTQAFNRRHRRVGHLFQGRYKAILVQAEPYLKALCRYVLLNPVRAGLARRARDWRWSGYRDLVDGPAPDWLARGRLLALFGHRPKGAARAFAAYVDGGAAPRGDAHSDLHSDPHTDRGAGAPWDDLKGQIYLGSEAFVAEMQARAGAGQVATPGATPRATPGATPAATPGATLAATLGEVPRAQRRAPPKPLAWFAERYPDRREAMARAHLEGGHGQARVADHFGVHYSTVSRAAKRLAADSGGDPEDG